MHTAPLIRTWRGGEIKPRPYLHRLTTKTEVRSDTNTALAAAVTGASAKAAGRFRGYATELEDLHETASGGGPFPNHTCDRIAAGGHTRGGITPTPRVEGPEGERKEPYLGPS